LHSASHAESEVPDLDFDVFTQIEVTHNHGYGLQKNGNSFEADLSMSLPILFKNGKPNIGKSRRQKQQSAD